MAAPRKKRRTPPAGKSTHRRTTSGKETFVHKADEDTYQDFLQNSGIKELGKLLRDLEARRQAMGLVPEDREPLRCPQCGLFEGSSADGMLFTSLKRHSKRDTGLRFTKLIDGRWLCPFCRTKVEEPEFQIPPDFWTRNYPAENDPAPDGEQPDRPPSVR